VFEFIKSHVITHTHTSHTHKQNKERFNDIPPKTTPLNIPNQIDLYRNFKSSELVDNTVGLRTFFQPFERQII